MHELLPVQDGGMLQNPLSMQVTVSSPTTLKPLLQLYLTDVPTIVFNGLWKKALITEGGEPQEVTAYMQYNKKNYMLTCVIIYIYVYIYSVVQMILTHLMSHTASD